MDSRRQRRLFGTRAYARAVLTTASIAAICASARSAGAQTVPPADLTAQLEAERELSMDLPLNRHQFRGAHNAWNHNGGCHYAGVDYNVVEGNQDLTLTELLNLGVRVLDIDAHTEEGEIVACHDDYNECTSGLVFSRNELYSQALREISAWLSLPGNEREIVMISVENELPSDAAVGKLADVFLDVFGALYLTVDDLRLDPRFTSWPGGPWPTPRDLLTWRGPGGSKRVLAKINWQDPIVTPSGKHFDEFFINESKPYPQPDGSSAQFQVVDSGTTVTGLMERARCFTRYNDNVGAPSAAMAMQDDPALGFKHDDVLFVADNKSQGTFNIQGYITANHDSSAVYPNSPGVNLCAEPCLAGTAGCHTIFTDTFNACMQPAFPMNLVQQCNVNFIMPDAWSEDLSRMSLHTWSPGEPTYGACAYADWDTGLLRSGDCTASHPYVCTRPDGDLFVTQASGRFEKGATVCAGESGDARTTFAGPGKPFDAYRLPTLNGYRDAWVNLSLTTPPAYEPGGNSSQWTRDTRLPSPPAVGTPGVSSLPAGTSGALAGSTAGAPDNHRVPSWCAPADGPDMAYRFTVTPLQLSGDHPVTVYFDTYGSSFDTILSITDGFDALPSIDTSFDGSQPNLGQTCNDDSGCGGADASHSRVWATITTPGTYYVVVDGKNGSAGDFALHWSFDGVAPVTKNDLQPGMDVLTSNVVSKGWMGAFDPSEGTPYVNLGVAACAGGAPATRSYAILACPGDTIQATSCVDGNHVDTVLTLRDGTGLGVFGSGVSASDHYLACNDDAPSGCHLYGVSPWSSTLSPYTSVSGGLYVLDVSRWPGATATSNAPYAVLANVFPAGPSVELHCTESPCTSLDTVDVLWNGLPPPWGTGGSDPVANYVNVNALGVFPRGSSPWWIDAVGDFAPFYALSDRQGTISSLAYASGPQWFGADDGPFSYGQATISGLPTGTVVGRALTGTRAHLDPTGKQDSWRQFQQIGADGPALTIVPPIEPMSAFASESAWAATNVADHSLATAYRSQRFSSSVNDRGTWLQVQFSSATTSAPWMQTLVLRAIMTPPASPSQTATAEGFPTSFEVWLYANIPSLGGWGWHDWGSFGTLPGEGPGVPDSSGEVDIHVGSAQVQYAFIEPTYRVSSLGWDSTSGQYEFQLAEVYGKGGVGGCADGTGQPFDGSAVGCGGRVTFDARASLCAPGFHVCSAVEWAQLLARDGGLAPTQDYWTDDALRWSGSGSGQCVVSTSSGNSCAANQPMRVCVPGGNDLEGNACTWTGCGFNTTTNQFFGGCTGISNSTAGTLCCQ